MICFVFYALVIIQSVLWTQGIHSAELFLDSMTDTQRKLAVSIYNYSTVPHRCHLSKLDILEQDMYTFFDYENEKEKTQIIFLQGLVAQIRRDLIEIDSQSKFSNNSVQNNSSFLKMAQGTTPFLEQQLTDHQKELMRLTDKYKKEPSLASPYLISAIREDINILFSDQQYNIIRERLLKSNYYTCIDVACLIVSNEEKNVHKKHCIQAIGDLAFFLNTENGLLTRIELKTYCLQKLKETIPHALNAFENDPEFEKKTFMSLLVLGTYQKNFEPKLVTKYCEIASEIMRDIEDQNQKDNNIMFQLPEWKKLIERFALLTQENREIQQGINELREKINILKCER
jgi:hypothetical protein